MDYNDPVLRGMYYDDLQAKLAAGEVTAGQAVKMLRRDITGLEQERFAKMCKVSVRTLRKIEAGEGNPTFASLDSCLKPFGFGLGVIRRPRRF